MSSIARPMKQSLSQVSITTLRILRRIPQENIFLAYTSTMYMRKFLLQMEKAGSTAGISILLRLLFPMTEPASSRLTVMIR